jgi:hypothetical protein
MGHSLFLAVIWINVLLAVGAIAHYWLWKHKLRLYLAPAAYVLAFGLAKGIDWVQCDRSVGTQCWEGGRQLMFVVVFLLGVGGASVLLVGVAWLGTLVRTRAARKRARLRTNG